jgi:hypothetical protein
MLWTDFVSDGDGGIRRNVSGSGIIEPFELHADLATFGEIRCVMIELVARQRQLDKRERQ